MNEGLEAAPAQRALPGCRNIGPRASVVALVLLLTGACNTGLNPRTEDALAAATAAPAAYELPGNSQHAGGVPPPGSASGCPSEAVRLSVTTCTGTPVPTTDEYWRAYHRMQNDKEDRGFFPYTLRGGEAVVIKGTKQPLASRPLSGTEEDYLALARSVACHGASKAGLRSDVVSRREALHGMGKTYFDASHWEAAAVAFHDAALELHPDGSDYAAGFALEALDALAQRDGRTDCRNALRARAEIYVQVLCGASSVGGEEMCSRLRARRLGPGPVP